VTFTGNDRNTARTRMPGIRRKRPEPDVLDQFVRRGFALMPAAAPLGPGCSCSRVGCPSPGTHPLSYGWRTEASADPAQLDIWRTRLPGTNFATPTGRTHDVLDVPAPAGRRALAALLAGPYQPGPVALSAAEDRYLFFTTARPGADEDRFTDEWWPCELDAHPETDTGSPGLRWHTHGSFVLVPPSRSITGGQARWIHGALEPLPDPLRILEALADACAAADGASRR
jgi:Bifunctional DNA primase/polymerase, N-terminal